MGIWTSRPAPALYLVLVIFLLLTFYPAFPASGWIKQFYGAFEINLLPPLTNLYTGIVEGVQTNLNDPIIKEFWDNYTYLFSAGFIIFILVAVTIMLVEMSGFDIRGWWRELFE